MPALCGGQLRKLAVNHAGCAIVIEDERMLPGVFGSSQESRSFEAMLLRRGVATLRPTCTALGNADRRGLVLAPASHVLPTLETGAQRIALVAGSAEFIESAKARLH